MIYVDRSRVSIPEDFAELARSETENLISRRKRAKADTQRRLPFNSKVWQTPDLRDSLARLFSDRCAYCESPLDRTQSKNIAHFRPRERAQQMNGEVSTDHYYWLAYDWENLYVSCMDCQSFKGSRFPVAGSRAAENADRERLDAERRLIIDPCRDEPEREFEYNINGLLEPKSERAETTIQVFGLNRKQLVSARRDLARRFDSEYRAARKSDKGMESGESPFAGFVQRALGGEFGFVALARQFAARAAKKPQVIVPSKSGSAAGSAPTIVTTIDVIADAMAIKRAIPVLRPLKFKKKHEGANWLQRVEVENFKALQKFEIEFPRSASSLEMNSNADIAQTATSGIADENEPWLMLLGENGVGKSTVLKAIALALMSRDQRKKLAGDPRQWISRGSSARSGCIRLQFTVGAEPVELHFSKRSSKVVVKGDVPDTPVLGYGSTRILPPSRARRSRPERVRVQNLFNASEPLRDAERWLGSPTEVNKRAFDLLAISLKQLLSLRDEDFITRRYQRMYASENKQLTPIRELSDGYQSVLALAIDMMLNLSLATFNMEGVEGVVLVDELEVHLHPRWKYKIVSALRSVFPRVRFIATTHDPLCVQGLREGELQIMTRQGESRDVKIEQFDVPAGARADQILTGAWFGVPTTRDPGTAKLMREHSALLQRATRTPAEQTRFDEVDRELRQRLDEYIGTEDEQIALQAAAQVRDERRQRNGVAGAVSANQLREKVLEALRSQPAAETP